MKYWLWMRRMNISGKVIDMVTRRKGELLVMETKGDMQHLEFEIPSRGLIGLRSSMLTNTAGEAVMAHRFLDYKPWKGPIPGQKQWRADRKKSGCHHSLFNRQTSGSRIILR